MKDKKQLTKSETLVMKALWELPGGQGYSSEIMAGLPEPKPAPTTLLTFLKILKDKGFVSSVKKGKSHLFTAIVKREDYMRHYMEDVKNTFFSGSLTSLVSFFAKEENLSDKEISDIIDIINHQKS